MISCYQLSLGGLSIVSQTARIRLCNRCSIVPSRFDFTVCTLVQDKSALKLEGTQGGIGGVNPSGSAHIEL